ncbi:unnamed protein product, partial [Ectocarpus fasciculatus]
ESAVEFDTAVKVYPQLVGHAAIDGAGARRYWYFMRLMGLTATLRLRWRCRRTPTWCCSRRAKRCSLQDIVREL